MLNCHVRLSNDKVYLVHSHFLGCSRNLSISFFVLSSCPVWNSLTDMIHLPWSVAIHYLWLNFVWANDNKDLNTFKLIAPSLKSTPVLNNRLFFIVEISLVYPTQKRDPYCVPRDLTPLAVICLTVSESETLSETMTTYAPGWIWYLYPLQIQQANQWHLS